MEHDQPAQLGQIGELGTLGSLESEYIKVAGDTPGIDARNENIYVMITPTESCDTCGNDFRTEDYAIVINTTHGEATICRACIFKAAICAADPFNG